MTNKSSYSERLGRSGLRSHCAAATSQLCALPQVTYLAVTVSHLENEADFPAVTVSVWKMGPIVLGTNELESIKLLGQ